MLVVIENFYTYHVKFSLLPAMKAQRGSISRAPLFLCFGVRSQWVVSVTPRPLYPRKDTRFPLYRRVVEPQGRSGLVRRVGVYEDSIGTLMRVANFLTDSGGHIWQGHSVQKCHMVVAYCRCNVQRFNCHWWK